jgi:MerR family mercuric resistance operon transcriptional regulator
MAMTIAKLAKTAGVGVETVRYYQRRGLMPVPKACGATYRTYDRKDAERLLFIRRAQAAGFTLEEIGELLKLDPRQGRNRVRELARERLETLENKIAELKASQAALEALWQTCVATAQGPCPIIEAFGSAHCSAAAH